MVPGINLKCGECIRYTCTYDVRDIQIQEGSNDVFGYLSIVIHLSVNSTNNNIFNVSYFNSTTKTEDSFIISTYNANLVSLDEYNNIIGNLEVSNTSIGGGTGGISPPNIQNYNVLGKSGIYSCIKRVIADFRQDTRVFYFIA